MSTYFEIHHVVNDDLMEERLPTRRNGCLFSKAYLEVGRIGRVPTTRTPYDRAKAFGEVFGELVHGCYSGLVVGISVVARVSLRVPDEHTDRDAYTDNSAMNGKLTKPTSW